MWDVWLRVSWGGRVGVGCVTESKLCEGYVWGWGGAVLYFHV